MSIHFAPANCAGLAPKSSPSAKVLAFRARRRVANDNVDFSEQSNESELVLKAALRHFAAHGLGAAKVARAQAEKAFYQGDQQTYEWWLDITRTLDRRMAANVSGQNTNS